MLGALAILGAGITAVYIFRLLALSFFGSFNEERWGGLKDMNKFEMAGGALLIVFILFMGLWPAPFVDRISPTIVNFRCRGSDERRDLNLDYSLLIPEYLLGGRGAR